MNPCNRGRRHLRRQPAALDIDVVAHLVGKDGQGDAQPVAPAEQARIQRDEPHETEQELELEDRQQQSLALGQQNGKRRQGTQFSRDGMALPRRCFLLAGLGHLQHAYVIAHPFRLF